MSFARPQPSPAAPVRTRGRARGIAFLPVLAPWALATFAQAQCVEALCSPGASCHPNGAGLGMGLTDADADAIGNELNCRREGDCTELGPDGCMALVPTPLMCLVDNRDWVQQYACADPPPPVATPRPRLPSPIPRRRSSYSTRSSAAGCARRRCARGARRRS